MDDENKTKVPLIVELNERRHRVAELEIVKTEHK